YRHVPPPLVAALRNDEGSEHHDAVHQEVVRGNIEPLQHPCHAKGQRVLEEKLLVVEPDDIVVIDMMAHMFVADVCERAVGSSANPGERASEVFVVPHAPEY